MKRLLLPLLLAAALVLAACGSDAAPSSGGEGSTGGGDAAGAAASWTSLPITDVDGETFTIEELAGRPVFVELFATWCSNCREQLGTTQEAAAAAGEDAVFLALSVETDLDPEAVAAYQRDEGFDDLRFAVLSEELLLAVKEDLGTSALNPPSTPKVAISSDGEVGELVTGFEDIEEIQAALGLA